MTTIISIALAHNLVDRLELVATSTREGSRDTVWHAWQSDPDQDEWTDWRPFGRLEPELMVDALQQHDGRMAVAVMGGDSDVRHRHQTGTSTWSDWSSLGSPPVDGLQSSLAFTQNDDDRLEVFATGQDGTAWHRWQRPPDTPPPWSTWTSMGLPHHGQISGPLVVTHDTKGRLEVFCVGWVQEEAPVVWHRWQVKAGGDWSAWTSLEAPPDLLFDVVLGVNADGRLEVFTVVDNGEVWHRWQQRPGEPESWKRPWESLGSPGSPPVRANEVAVAMDAHGHLTLVVTARDGRELWQRTQAPPPAPLGWGKWTRLPAVPTAPVERPLLYLNRLGGLGLFLVTPSTGGLYQLTQPTPDDAWTGRRWSSP
jgi:hypothetical protein